MLDADELDYARVKEAKRRTELPGIWPDISLIAARLAREGWTPPEVVDPDLAEAETLWSIWLNAHETPFELALAAIKRGRALAAAEAKPKGPQTAAFQAGSAGYRDWHDITHHAIITPPAEGVA